MCDCRRDNYHAYCKFVTTHAVNKLKIPHIEKYDKKYVEQPTFYHFDNWLYIAGQHPRWRRVLSKNFKQIYNTYHVQQIGNICGGLRANADMYSPDFEIDIYGPTRGGKKTVETEAAPYEITIELPGICS